MITHVGMKPIKSGPWAGTLGHVYEVEVDHDVPKELPF